MHLLFLLVVVSLALAAADPLNNFCGSSGNYTANSTYQSNLNRISTTLPADTSTSPTLFNSTMIGTIPNQLFALALCRGDQNASACLACLTTAFQDAQKTCPYSKDVTRYYDRCLLRFSNQNFLSSTGNNGLDLFLLTNTSTVTSSTALFNYLTSALMNATADYAAANSSNKFATGQADFDKQYPKIYGLTQCTPDLTPSQCRDCLAAIIADMGIYLDGMQGGGRIGVRCNYRYELYQFYNGVTMLQLPETAFGAPAGGNGGTPVVKQGEWMNQFNFRLLKILDRDSVTTSFSDIARLNEFN